MGREVERVPLGFDWPIGEVWFGYILEVIPCRLCGGSGKPKSGGPTEYCPTCEGEGKCRPRIELPEGPGWQMWENTSEGSPISPVFETPEELAHWLADTGASAFAEMGASYEQWLATIRRGGAVSAALTPQGIVPGVTLNP